MSLEMSGSHAPQDTEGQGSSTVPRPGTETSQQITGGSAQG